MRRWIRIESGTFNKGDILVLESDDGTACPSMRRIIDGKISYSDTKRMVEIDEYGNVIRRYSEDDRLNEGTLVTGNIPVGCVEDRIAVLEKEVQELKKIQSLEKENEFEPGWYACWDDNTSCCYINFIPTNECLNHRLSIWDNVDKIDKDAFDKILNPKTTIYDWSKIPEWATFAVMNESGKVFCGDHEGGSILVEGSIINRECFWSGKGVFKHGWQRLDKTFVLNPPDDWKDSFERRPE